jgi:predicted NUDIX family phosphoesterase
MLLETNDNNRIKNRYTFIQGHVEFSPEIYLKSQIEYLRMSAIRELEEEIQVPLDDQDKKRWALMLAGFPQYPKYLINLRTSHIELEHFGLVYEMTVTPEVFDIFLGTLKSGEPEKHNITQIDLRDRSSYEGKLDNWVQAIVDQL